MARARLIKPGFFLNDELAEIEPLGRLLFAGLWTIADREGRLEDRTKKIKIEVLPYDVCDVDALLDDLHNRGFITRYTVNGQKYIQISNFSKHQNPHCKEKESIIPPIPGLYDESTIQAPCKNDASMVQELEKHDSKTALTLNPLTLTLNPSHDESLPTASKRVGVEKVPFAEIEEHFTRICISLPKPSKLSSARKTAIKTRWIKDLDQDFSKLDAFLHRVENSDFLTGRTSARNKPFGIDWIFKESNFLKIQEGNYDNKTPSQSKRMFTPEEEAPCTFGLSQAMLEDRARRMGGGTT